MSPLVIWRLSDGRRGHDNQSLGLVEALARAVALECVDVHVSGSLSGAVAALAAPARAPRPALVVAAGHATHLALIVTAWRQRARSIVLMNPSLPRMLFDLCIVPAHDGVEPGRNVHVSLGALNRMRPSSQREPDFGLILLGGSSRHHRWNDTAIVAQIRALAAAQPAWRWIVAGSPRTPTTALGALEAVGNVRVVRFEDTTAEWLPENLARASVVWVSEDSVSMAYEAVSCGAPTGLIEVPARRQGRVQAAVRTLCEAGLAIDFTAWRAGASPRPPARALQEADRCARALLERWPDLTA